MNLKQPHGLKEQSAYWSWNERVVERFRQSGPVDLNQSYLAFGRSVVLAKS